jgi:alkylated DNA repair dioxygenase AlkB
VRVALQQNLFGTQGAPEGFQYANDLISADEERALVAEIAALDFKEFKFQGFLAKRRVVSFGWRYDFERARLEQAEAIPSFLQPLRARAAKFAGIDKNAIDHVLVTEYAPGVEIGWHKDRPNFEDVVGVSLLTPCTFRFRRKRGTKWERFSLTAEPRSVYLLRGPSRWEWEHSIPAVPALRYSVTFRTLRNKPA